MDKLESWKRTEDVEVDLPDLLRSIFIRWKQVLVCALLGALVLGGYGWWKNAAQASGDDMAGKAELTEEEKQDVESAVQLYLESKALEKYLEESILMRIDPYHKNRAVMLYSVEDTKRKDVQKIIAHYVGFLADGGAAAALEKSGVQHLDRSFFSELVLAYQKTDSVPLRIVAEEKIQDGVTAGELFYVEITGENSEMVQQLAEDVQAALKQEYTDIAKTAGSHKLKLAGSWVSEVVDDALQAQQHDKRAQLKTNLADLKIMTDAFGEGQKAAYAKAAGLTALEENPKEPKEGQTAGFGISIKYILAGFAGGIFLYCCIYACLYLVRDTLKSAGEIKRIYTFPFLGSICLEDKPGGAGFWKRADGSRFQTGQAAAGGQVQTTGRIRLACRNQGITNLVLASELSFTSREKECIEEIIRKLKEWGIDAYAAQNAGSDTALWDGMARTGNVLIICRIGATTRRMIDEQMRFYMENGIAVTGVVAFI